MAETALTKTTAPGKFSQTGTILTMAAADVGNGNKLAGGGDILILAHNTGASTRTVTITSVADPVTGRTGSVTAQNILAGEYRIFRLSSFGWANSAGEIIIAANHAEVKFGVIDL